MSYIVLDRTWKDGDRVTLQLPMQIAVRRWPKNQDAASVSYGPLGFSLAIRERWEKYGDPKAKWPEWEVFPESAWNYGLVLDAQDPARSFEIVRQAGRSAAGAVHARCRAAGLEGQGAEDPELANGSQPDGRSLAAQPGPIDGAAGRDPADSAGGGPFADWHVPRDRRRSRRPRLGCPGEAETSAYKASASHCYEGDTLEALGNGLEPASSDDESIPRFTWWPHKGSQEWVQYTLPAAAKLPAWRFIGSTTRATGNAACRSRGAFCGATAANGNRCRMRPNFPVAKDRFNSATFAPVTTDAVRLEVQLQKGFSGGILQWRLKPDAGAKP